MLNNPNSNDLNNIINNIDNSDFDIDKFISEGLSKFDSQPTADYSKDVLSTMPADVQKTFDSIYGKDFFNKPEQMLKPTQPITQPSQTSTTQNVQNINPYTDRSKDYKYKRFYGEGANGFDAVDMKSMGLKGQIWSGNSVPFIRKEYADAMHWLDDKFASNGIKIIYTSAMGGKHQQSSSGRGHGDGAKLDAQGVIPPQLYRELYNRRYFGEGTGAIGYEIKGSNKVCTPDEYERLYKAGKVSMANGNHYDFSNKYASEYLAMERKNQNTNPLIQDNTAIAFANSNQPVQSKQTGRLPVDDVLDFVDRQNELNKTQRPKSSMEQVSLNPWENVTNNARRIGTAMTALWTGGWEALSHPITTSNNILRAVNDYAKQYKYSPEDIMTNAMTDVLNALTQTYNIDLRTVGYRDPLDVLKGAIVGAYANPIDFIFDVISFGGAGVVRKLISKVPGLSQAANAGKVENAIATERAALAQKEVKASEKLTEINKLADKAGISREQLFKAAEEGKNILPKGEKTEELWKLLKSASDDFDNLAKVYKPESYVGKERMSIIQKILRDRELTQPGITFEQVRREVTPYLDTLAKEKGLAKIEKSVNKGDKIAKEVYEAKKLFDNNEIMPITHMLAEVDKSFGKAAVEAGKLTDAYVKAAQFTTRMYGNAKYADIAAQWAKPQKYLSNLMDSYLEGGIANSILKGEFAPVAEGVKKLGKASYLDRKLLEQGKLREALKNARKEPVSLDDIAIDNDMLAPLKSQIDVAGGGYGGALKQAANTVKGVMLSGLQYLGPNAITGMTNAILTSGPMVIADIVSAIKSQGKLTKNLGVYRYEKPAQLSTIPGLRQIDWLNNKLGGRQARRADRAIQNVMAEIAAHGEMRRAGIPFAKRVESISQMDKAKLGEVITDVKRSALINSPKALLPDTATDFLSVINPFWRWQDTATQATYNVLRKNPILANLVLQDIMGSIAFDKEMQNRLNLNVDLDKPYVVFRPDLNRPDHVKTITAEFVPMTTPLKMIDFGQMKERPVSFATFGPIINAFNGVDRYGKPIKRPDMGGMINQISGTRRYEKAPGQPWQEIKGGKGDEILSAAFKSFVGPATLYNRTIAPVLASIASPTGQFYQPYANSMFGVYNRDAQPGHVFSGNPTQGRTAGDVLRAFGGIYEQEYHPEYDRISPSMQRNLMTDYLRGQIRLNRQGY